MGTVVSCPTCSRAVKWSSTSIYRPFCSERCKLIDLGAWASESYSIAGKPQEGSDDPGSEESKH